MINPQTTGVAMYETTQAEAKLHAEIMADKSELPQTIFRNADTAGWWHTNCLASVLGGAEVFMSVLPRRYFLYRS